MVSDSSAEPEGLDLRDLVAQATRVGARAGMTAFAQELRKLGVSVETINLAIEHTAERVESIRDEIGDPTLLIFAPKEGDANG